jgi:transposase
MTGTEPHAWETGLMDTITYVGLDVHKATVCVAVAEGGRGGEIRQVGVFENRPEIVMKLAARLSKGGRRLSFCYEAGPCGYGLHRQLTGCGHDCVVVAPSLIPVKAGDRVKTDRRDAVTLAKLHRAGELTPIWIPDAAHEAMRDLVRARATAGRVLSKARQHLQSFLLRHDQIYRGARAWTLAYRRWLTTVRFAHPAQQIVLQDYIHAVQDAEARLDRLTRQIEELLPSWSMAPVVTALQAMRGIALVVAVTVVAEVGDFRRFANAATADGLSRPGALRTFVWGQRQAPRHHQGRQCAGTARADRGSLDLPHAGTGEPKTARPQTRSCRQRSATLPERPNCASARAIGALPRPASRRLW